jgi:hypothetical protein
LRRGISEIVAVLIILGVLVGVGVVVYTLAFNTMKSVGPDASYLSIMSARVHTSDGKTLVVELDGSVIGRKTISISKIELKIDVNGALTTVDAQLTTSNAILQPGQLFHIVAKASLNTQIPPYSDVIVTVKYCDFSGSCDYVSTITQVELS